MRFPSKKELLSNFANLYSVPAPLQPIPVPEKYPPSFVITWDKRRHRPKMTKGKNFLANTDAQVGGIVMLVLGVFIIGFLYIVLGYIEGFYVTQNNLLITGQRIPYSQDHADSLSDIFAYWWGIPIFTVIIFIIYAIKTGTQSTPGESY